MDDAKVTDRLHRRVQHGANVTTATNSKIELDAIALRRLGELRSVFKQRGDTEDSSQELDEYVTLKDEVLPAVEEVANLLVRAGLLTITVDLTPEIVESVSGGEYQSITLEPVFVYSNGNVRVAVGNEPSGGISIRRVLFHVILERCKEDGVPELAQVVVCAESEEEAKDVALDMEEGSQEWEADARSQARPGDAAEVIDVTQYTLPHLRRCWRRRESTA